MTSLTNKILSGIEGSSMAKASSNYSWKPRDGQMSAHVIGLEAEQFEFPNTKKVVPRLRLKYASVEEADAGSEFTSDWYVFDNSPVVGQTPDKVAKIEMARNISMGRFKSNCEALLGRRIPDDSDDASTIQEVADLISKETPLVRMSVKSKLNVNNGMTYFTDKILSRVG